MACRRVLPRVGIRLLSPTRLLELAKVELVKGNGRYARVYGKDGEHTICILSLPAVGDGAAFWFIVTAIVLTPLGGNEPARAAAACCAVAHPARRYESKL